MLHLHWIPGPPCRVRLLSCCSRMRAKSARTLGETLAICVAQLATPSVCESGPLVVTWYTHASLETLLQSQSQTRGIQGFRYCWIIICPGFATPQEPLWRRKRASQRSERRHPAPGVCQAPGSSCWPQQERQCQGPRETRFPWNPNGRVQVRPRDQKMAVRQHLEQTCAQAGGSPLPSCFQCSRACQRGA